ncbi:MAG: CopG family antitoxin [Candidatus Methylomirabilia bacterium]
MRQQPRIPQFKDDREAADFWAAHDSTPYLRELRETGVKASAALRRRVAARAAAKKPVTLRLEPRQIAAAKRVARRKSIPYQTLLRMWIAEALARERVG